MALLFVPMLFAACKKTDSPANEFIINGIHDVNFSAVGSNILALSVNQTSGNQEPVTITVTGLPSGINVDIQPASGTPAFGSSVTFTNSGTALAGTYPIKIVGTSASYTKSYDLNVVVPALNGFMFDGKTYNKTSLNHVTNNFGGYILSQILVYTSDNGGGYLSADFSQDWPTADGTYNFHLGGMSTNSMYVSFNPSSSSLPSWDNDDNDTTQQATLKIAGGKMTLNISNAKMTSSSTSGTKNLTVNVSE